MKVLVCIHAYLGLSVGTMAAERGLNLGSECEFYRQCQSQHCLRFCEDKRKAVCIEASWFYERHGLGLPSCIEEKEYRKKMQYTHKRQLGETCHSDVNCASTRCVPQCGNGPIFRCSESLEFYQQNRMEPPKCIEMDNSVTESDTGISAHILERKVQQKGNDKKDDSAKMQNNAKEDKTNLRKEEKQEQPKVEATSKKEKAVVPKDEKNNNAQESKANVLTAEEEDTAADIEAARLEAESLEKLRQIDMKVLELQSGVMKKNGKNDSVDGEKRKTNLFTAWLRSLQKNFGFL